MFRFELNMSEFKFDFNPREDLRWGCVRDGRGTLERSNSFVTLDVRPFFPCGQKGGEDHEVAFSQALPSLYNNLLFAPSLILHLSHLFPDHHQPLGKLYQRVMGALYFWTRPQQHD